MEHAWQLSWALMSTVCWTQRSYLTFQAVCLHTNCMRGADGPWHVLTPKPCLGISYMAQTDLGLNCPIFHKDICRVRCTRRSVKTMGQLRLYLTWQPRYKALTQRPHLNLSHLFYDVDRPYVPWISIFILKTILVLSCLEHSKSQQSLGYKALSLQRLLCAFHAQLQPGQCYSSATQDHTCTHPAQGGAHCVDPQLSHPLEWVNTIRFFSDS